MIDLKELEREIDALLDSETPESLKDWLLNHRQKEIESYLGQGVYLQEEQIDRKTCKIISSLATSSEIAVDVNVIDGHNYMNAA